MPNRSRIRFFLAAAAALAPAAMGQAPSRPDPEPTGEAPPAPAPDAAPAPPEFPDAGTLLTALETGDAGLTSLTAQLVYIKTFAIAGDHHVRRGRLYFSAEPAEGDNPPRRAFGVWFDTLQIGEMLHETAEAHIFDGRFYVERLEKEKRFTKREVVAPGEQADPLRLGEGPFPIPIGQKKDEILRRFDASVQDPEGALNAEANPDAPAEQLESLRAFVVGAVQLRLVPRSGVGEEIDFAEVRLWYRRGDDGRLLPRLSRTVNPAGDISYVMLANPQANTAVPPEKTSTQTPEGGGWEIRIEPWDQAAR